MISSVFLTESKKGELYVLSADLLWSLFPIVSIFSLETLSPLMAAALSTLLAVPFFAAVVTYKKGWHQFRQRSALLYILASALLIGVLFYGLVFVGFRLTTAGNSSIMLLMEVFFTMLILHLWGKEKLKRNDLFGGMLVVFGALIILFPGTLQVNRGDLIILLATAAAPVGNYFSQRARKLVSSEFILFIRSTICGLFLLCLALLLGPSAHGSEIVQALPFLLINGIFLLGLTKIFWTEAIHRISITKAQSLSAIAPAFTLFFAYIFLNETPTLWQIMGFIPIFLGVQLLSDFFPGKETLQKAP